MNTDERKGHTSASNAQADLLCPGRHLAQRGLPERKGYFSEIGTRIHAALAENARENINVGALAGLTLEERETFDRCREIEKRKVAEFFPDTRDNNDENKRLRVFREQRYWGKSKSGFEHSAKPDAVFRAGLRALIIEYKTLFGDVPESARNLQLRDQAVLVRGNFRGMVTEIGTVVVQPGVTMNPEICLYTKEDLDRSEKEMWVRVEASNNPASLRVPGEVQCQWCLAKPQCQEYHRWAALSVPQMASLVDLPVTQWTVEQRVLFLDRLPIAKKWLEECKNQLEAGLAADPAFVPGWELAPGRIREPITNPQECFGRFTALGGKLNDFMGCITVGKTDLRKAVSDLTGARGKALDNAMDTLLKGIIGREQDKASLKRSEKKL